MTDISREEMGLIIGLVLGTLFLALLAVLFYILYDRQKEKVSGILRITAPEPPRNGRAGSRKPGCLQIYYRNHDPKWTTINNSMVGLEIEDANSHVGHEGDLGNDGCAADNGGFPHGNRRSCLTVLFDWDPKQPLPKPFKHFSNTLWQEETSGSRPSLPSDPGVPTPPVAPAGNGSEVPAAAADAAASPETSPETSAAVSVLPSGTVSPILSADASGRRSSDVSPSSGVAPLLGVGDNGSSSARPGAQPSSKSGGRAGLMERIAHRPGKFDIRCFVCVGPTAVEDHKVEPHGMAPAAAPASLPTSSAHV